MILILVVVTLVLTFVMYMIFSDDLVLFCDTCEKRKPLWRFHSHEIVDGAYDCTFYKAVCKSCHEKEESEECRSGDGL